MKRLKFLIAAIFTLCIIAGYTHRALYAEEFDDIVSNIQKQSKQWGSILNEFSASKQLNHEHLADLTAAYSAFIKDVEYNEHYSGVYLVTREFFPLKEGLLLTYENIQSIQADGNTGVRIEKLPMLSELSAYRLCYYWD